MLWGKFCTLVLLIWVFIPDCCSTALSGEVRPALLNYAREQLLLLRPGPGKSSPAPALPEGPWNRIYREQGYPRKRGRRGGVKRRLNKRANKPPLPSMLLCNARSLKQKMDNLKANVGAQREYRDSCILVVNETWLTPDFPDSLATLDGFSMVRADRNRPRGTVDPGISNTLPEVSGGGLAVYINQRWCSQFTVRERICTENIEMLCISMRPFYLPREFGNIIICAVYIPPRGKAYLAARSIADCVHDQLERTPEAPCFVLGDFNHCKLEATMPGFYQYVGCYTRGEKTLDKCYGNVKKAYAAKARPPLSSLRGVDSDHKVVHLIPTYKSLFKSSKPVVKTVHVWNNDSIDTLRGCFSLTDWEIFYDELELDEATDTITEYIKFCTDYVIPMKQITMYPNNKSRISMEIKGCISQRNRAFQRGDRVAMRNSQTELNRMLKLARKKEKEKLEAASSSKDTRGLWDSMKKMTNMAPVKHGLCVANEEEKANELCDFFSRFETVDFSAEREAALESIPNSERPNISIKQKGVRRMFKQVCPRKAAGPDGISGALLKACSEEMAEVWCPIYQKSLDLNTVPLSWKNSIIIPVPKTACCKENNDYRPVALTSIVMKCFEKIIVSLLKYDVSGVFDPFQFAYRCNRGTDDAITALTHIIVKHLDHPQAFARLLFVDFSSAFNTIQPHLLIKKLVDLDVHPQIIKWYHSFLSNRKQWVSVNGTLSRPRTLSTGAPQGCVSSPVLFVVNTNDCRSSHPSCYIFKFSDDSAILALMKKGDDLSNYFSVIDSFVKWGDSNHLVINTKKTEEMVFDPKRIGGIGLAVIHGVNIAQVSSYKYLGVHIDDQLSWSIHVDVLCSRLQQRLHFLRRLRLHGADKKFMLIFYKSVFVSIIRYGITAWFGNLTVQLKSKLVRLIEVALKIIGATGQPILQDIFDQATLKLASKIVVDPTHVLYNDFELLLYGMRKAKYRVPMGHRNLNRFKKSFVPLAINMLNLGNQAEQDA